MGIPLLVELVVTNPGNSCLGKSFRQENRLPKPIPTVPVTLVPLHVVQPQCGANSTIGDQFVSTLIESGRLLDLFAIEPACRLIKLFEKALSTLESRKTGFGAEGKRQRVIVFSIWISFDEEGIAYRAKEPAILSGHSIRGTRNAEPIRQRNGVRDAGLGWA